MVVSNNLEHDIFHSSFRRFRRAWDLVSLMHGFLLPTTFLKSSARHNATVVRATTTLNYTKASEALGAYTMPYLR